MKKITQKNNVNVAKHELKAICDGMSQKQQNQSKVKVSKGQLKEQKTV